MIPRRMYKERLQGFLLVKKVGPLPCETMEDCAELKLLAKDYLNAIARGVIVMEAGRMPYFSAIPRTRRDSEVLKILFKHIQKNLWIIEEMRREMDLMMELIEESNVDIGYISLKRLQQLIKSNSF